jgi:hypothetical protein
VTGGRVSGESRLGTFRSMSVWQYAQLTITLDSRNQDRKRTVLWHGPGAELAEDLSESEPRVLDLLNRVGAEGWELTSQEEQRQQEEGRTYWDASWCLTTYTFKRRVEEPSAAR